MIISHLDPCHIRLCSGRLENLKLKNFSSTFVNPTLEMSFCRFGLIVGIETIKSD